MDVRQVLESTLSPGMCSDFGLISIHVFCGGPLEDTVRVVAPR